MISEGRVSREGCVNIIPDEVQSILSIFAGARSIVDEDRCNGRFIWLGSVSPQLVKRIGMAGKPYYLILKSTSISILFLAMATEGIK